MQLKEIYQPIEKELESVANALEKFLGESENESILKINSGLKLLERRFLQVLLFLWL